MGLQCWAAEMYLGSSSLQDPKGCDHRLGHALCAPANLEVLKGPLRLSTPVSATPGPLAVHLLHLYLCLCTHRTVHWPMRLLGPMSIYVTGQHPQN